MQKVNLFDDKDKKYKIIIIASHIKEDLEKLADIVYQFDDGKIKLYNK